MYLKKHRAALGRRGSPRSSALASPPSPGRVEAENALALQSLGIDVMPLMAYGEKLHADGRLESFLLTRGTGRILRAAGFHSATVPARDAPSRRPSPNRTEATLPANLRSAPLDRAGGRHRPAVPCGRLQSSRLLLLPLPGQGNVAGPVRRPPDRPAAGPAAAVVPAEMDRQGPGPIGQHVARRSRRLPREDPLSADLPGRAEAAAARQAAGPRRALETIAGSAAARGTSHENRAGPGTIRSGPRRPRTVDLVVHPAACWSWATRCTSWREAAPPRPAACRSPATRSSAIPRRSPLPARSGPCSNRWPWISSTTWAWAGTAMSSIRTADRWLPAPSESCSSCRHGSAG